MNATLSRFAPHALSLLRIMAALLLLQHGMTKFFSFPGTATMPATFSLFWWAGLIELVGGALLLIGLFSRAAAFLLAGHLAFVYFIGHAPRSFYPLVNNGTLPVLYCFVFFYLIFAGPGPWSLDRIMRRD